MIEFMNLLKIANSAIKAVEIIEVIKKLVVVSAVTMCGILVFRLIKSSKINLLKP